MPFPQNIIRQGIFSSLWYRPTTVFTQFGPAESESDVYQREMLFLGLKLIKNGRHLQNEIDYLLK